MPLTVEPLTLGEQGVVSEDVIGKTTCPTCGQKDIAVVNDSGKDGDPQFNYLENHYPVGSGDLCMGSEKFLSDFP